MKKRICAFMLAGCLLAINVSAQTNTREFSGIVTLQLMPAKVIKINKIIENPEPGVSYIGEDGILVEVEENPNVIANWTVVNIKYYKYQEPKTIKYEIFPGNQELTVNYHAVSIDVTGDLSAYIEE